MPRRNISWLLLIGVVSVVCYERAPTNRYGHVLTNALEHINRDYAGPSKAAPKECPPLDAQLFEGAMEGMVGRLGDPYSGYISRAKLDQFRNSLNEEFEGVGMEVILDPKTKQLTVVSPLPDEPAFKADIRAGDKILKIDGVATQGMAMEDAVEKIHGKPGTEVKLTVLHEGETKPVEIPVVRKRIDADTVRGDTRNRDGTWNFFLAGADRIGYLRIHSFVEKNGGKTTVKELTQALDWLVEHGMRGLVLDLRHNPGGALSAAVGTCDLFLREGVIVTTRDRDERVLKAFHASGKGRFTDFPMVILVDGQSASAAEIVAACLQDHGRATVVGEQTFGKGTVQEVLELGPQCGALKLTIAGYRRPSGKNIDRRVGTAKNEAWGVSPDEGSEVKVESEEAVKVIRWRQQREVYRPADTTAPPPISAGSTPDRVLLKAIEWLERKAK